MFSCVVRFQDQRADGDEDDAAADGVQAEGLSNGDFQFPVLILLLWMIFFFWFHVMGDIDGRTEGVQAHAAMACKVQQQMEVGFIPHMPLFRFRVDSSIHCITINSKHMLARI